MLPNARLKSWEVGYRSRCECREQNLVCGGHISLVVAEETATNNPCAIATPNPLARIVLDGAAGSISNNVGSKTTRP
jgi:hypothetical protein